MGFLVDTQKEGGGHSWGYVRSLVRRKQVDSANKNVDSQQQQLAKALTVPHLIAIGVGATIGAGVYILVGTVAREHSGPALALSFLIAGIAAGLSAFCYAELSSRCPSAGSAYHYFYICVGEGFQSVKAAKMKNSSQKGAETAVPACYSGLLWPTQRDFCQDTCTDMLYQLQVVDTEETEPEDLYRHVVSVTSDRYEEHEN